jgi:hypothetical protein
MRTQKQWDELYAKHTNYCPFTKKICKWVGDRKNWFEPNICVKAQKPLTEVKKCLGFNEFISD